MADYYFSMVGPRRSTEFLNEAFAELKIEQYLPQEVCQTHPSTF